MKKLFSLFMLVAMVVAAQAQSLTDVKWFSDMSDNDADGGMMILFDPEGVCALSLIMVQGKDGLTVNIGYTVPGVFSVEGNELTVTLLTDMAEIEAEIDTEGLTPEQQQVVKQMQPVIDEQKAEIKGSLDESFNWQGEKFVIAELTATRLVLVDSTGEETVFTPFDELLQ